MSVSRIILIQKIYCYRSEVKTNRFCDIIEKYGLKVRKAKRRIKPMDSSHDYPFYPDLKREYIPTAPCSLHVSDITYIPYWIDPETGKYRFCYLALITDYYTKEIVGYKSPYVRGKI